MGSAPADPSGVDARVAGQREPTAADAAPSATQDDPTLTEAAPAAVEPTWDWAVSVLPALANHSEDAPSAQAMKRFARWFSGSRARTIYLRQHDQCSAVRGSVDGGFRHRETVETDGDSRTETGYSLAIDEHGITESGPGGTTSRRDARGKWIEVGGFGTGCSATLVHNSMSRVDDGVAYFNTYAYRLTAECEHMLTQTQHCEGGGTRTCTRCAGIWLHPHAPQRGWARGHSGVVGQRHPPPLHDCSQPCPADEWSDRVEPLNQVLAGRRFFSDDSGDPGVLFRSAKACRRAARRVRQRDAQADG